MIRRLRCAACGRWRKPSRSDLCQQCDARGFVALRLPGFESVARRL